MTAVVIRYLAAKGARVLLVTSQDVPGLRADGWHVIADPFDQEASDRRDAEIEEVRKADESRGPLPPGWGR